MQRSNWDEHNISSIKKLKLRGRPGTIALSERKGSFIEDDMPRNNDSIGREVKAALSFMVSGVAQEDAQGGARGEFVGGCGRQVGITFATKDSKVTIRRGVPRRAWCGVEKPRVLVGRMLIRTVAVERASTQ